MHKKLLLILFFGLSSFLFSSCSAFRDSVSEVPNTVPSNNTSNSTGLSSTPSPVPSDFTARFEIYTNGTKRIFTEVKYHHQSTDVYIENPDPHLVHIKKSGTTWQNFFDTLPFSLQKECLITGTNQTFCNTETKKLHFYLNGQEEPDALERTINPDDFLRVEYKSISKALPQ